MIVVGGRLWQCTDHFALDRHTSFSSRCYLRKMTETVVLETNMGDIQFELYTHHAPKVPTIMVSEFLGFIYKLLPFYRPAKTSQN